MDWSQFWSAIVGGLIASPVLSYLVKTFIAQQLATALEDYRHKNARELEAHKAALTNELHKDLESYRAVLRRSEIEFSGLYERRADATVDVAYRLRLLFRETANYVSIFQGPEAGGDEATKKWDAAHRSFRDCFDKNRVFFDSATQERLDEARKSLYQIASRFRRGRMKEELGRFDDEDYWSKCEDKASEEINTTLVDLERQFRRLIGVHERDGTEPSAGLPTFAEIRDSVTADSAEPDSGVVP